MLSPFSQTRPPNSRRVWIVNAQRPGLLGWLARYYAFAAVVGLPVVLCTGVATLRYFADRVPEVAKVASFRDDAAGITRIYAAHGEVLSELAREHRAYAPFREIPDRLALAFLAAEDRRFFEHDGLDFRGLARAMVANYRQGSVVQGGSTITQQVAKSFLDDRERTLERKIIEAILAFRIEASLGKPKILEIYLNKIFLGHSAYGVAAAASRYFDKQLGELTLAESAMIAGLARAPSGFSPHRHPEAALRRRNVVLQAMVEAGYIAQEEAESAKTEPVKLAETRDVFRWRSPYFAEAARLATVSALGEGPVFHDGLTIETTLQAEFEKYARWAADRNARALDRRMGWQGPVAHLSRDEQRGEFLRRATAHYADKAISKSPDRWHLGLVTESKPFEAQIQVGDQKAVLSLKNANWAIPYNRMSGLNGGSITSLRGTVEPGDVIWVKFREASERKDSDNNLLPHVSLGQEPKVEATVFAMEAQTGYVEAMIGGLDYDRSQFNRAMQACRQPGSVFKAVYYALALDGDDWHMDSILEAKPWVPEPGEEWNPRNIDKTVDGRVLLRTALIRSLNTPSIRLFVALGAPAVVDWSRKLGITTELIADKGLSLGASCVLTHEITNVFTTYARGGSKTDPVLVRRVIDKHGNVRLDQRHPEDPNMDLRGRAHRMLARAQRPDVQLIDERTNFLITRLLREVVTAGIGSRASTIGIPAAGKSGSASGRFARSSSVQDLTTDTWFVGFTSRHVAAAWMGFDNVQERSLGDEEASYTTATPLWTDFMGKIVENHENEYLNLPQRRPAGFTTQTVDAKTGGLPVPNQLQATIYVKTR
jgi:penicillin-binding protein 1A